MPIAPPSRGPCSLYCCGVFLVLCSVRAIRCATGSLENYGRNGNLEFEYVILRFAPNFLSQEKRNEYQVGK